MPRNAVHTKHDEQLWAKAKRIAKAINKGKPISHALVMYEYQKLKRAG